MTIVLPPASEAAIAEAHPCAVPGCELLCSPGHVACRAHWRNVPQEDRDPLIEAFRRRTSHLALYQQACARAVTLVQQHASSRPYVPLAHRLPALTESCSRCGRGWPSAHAARECAVSHGGVR